jgi:transposase
MIERRDAVAYEQRRLGAAKMFRKGVRQADVARRLKVSTASVAIWAQAYRQGGEAALVRKPRSGRPKRLTASQCRRLERLLLQGTQAQGYVTELWTSPRVAKLIVDLFGVRYHRNHIPKLLSALGWSCQRPRRQAIERDEKAIEQWKKVTWPRIKKKSRA